MFKKENKKISWFRKGLIIYLTVILVIVSFLLGIFVGSKRGISSGMGTIFNKYVPENYLSRDVDFDLFWKVWDLVKKNYVKQPVKETKLFYSSLAGIVAGLEDPYSVFLDPETAQKFSQELLGRFEGIGAEIGIKKNQLMIIAPLSDTPAERVGLRPKDKILAIDGKDTRGMPLDMAVNLIRGKKGTKVVLTIMRQGFEKPQDFEIIRGVIKIQTVKWEMLENNIAYIKISHFNSKTEKEFRKAVDEVLKNRPRALILDLRNNPGGYLSVAVDVANYWVSKGKVVVYERFSDNRKLAYKNNQGKNILANLRTIVLVNEGSASASEIVAGALQDYNLATILGEKTFGKGSVQELNNLPDGSAVKLTIAYWLTPQEHIIEEEGISPDVEVELTLEDYNNDRDPQLEKALELLGQ